MIPHKGITLIELIITISIIFMLIGLCFIPSMQAKRFNKLYGTNYTAIDILLIGDSIKAIHIQEKNNDTTIKKN
jgi:competence protein ComGC